MKISCNIIMDLLPLYHDGICNESSKEVVEGHLRECDKCREMLERIRNNTVDNFLVNERNNVVRQHAQAVRRKSLIVGVSIASVMAVPVLISLIVNIAVGRALDWFFIVLVSLVLFASVTVVPLIIGKNKGLWTLGSFTASLTLLLMTISIYSGGDWFFVAIIPVLFGFSVVFAPFVVRCLPLKGFLARHRGLFVMTVNTLLLCAVIFVSGIYTRGNFADYWRLAILITPVCLTLPWGLFLIIRYFKANAFIKAGLCVVFGGLFFTFIENAVYWIVNGTLRLQFRNANLFTWTVDNVDANVFLLTLLTGGVVGGALVVVGLLRGKGLS